MIYSIFIINFSILAVYVLIIFAYTFIASFSIGKKFDKLFKDLPADVADPQNMVSSKFFYRPFAYMMSIACGQRFSNKPNSFHFYGDYDFRANATKNEIRFSYFFFLIVCSGGVFLFLGAILLVIAKIMHVPL